MNLFAHIKLRNFKTVIFSIFFLINRYGIWSFLNKTIRYLLNNNFKLSINRIKVACSEFSQFNSSIKSKLIVSSKELSRNEMLLSFVNKRGVGLEIGPSYNPVAPKKDGYNVTIVDHTDAKSLRKKYLEMGVNVEKIEDVDIIWNSGSLFNAVQKAKCFDYIRNAYI